MIEDRQTEKIIDNKKKRQKDRQIDREKERGRIGKSCDESAPERKKNMLLEKGKRDGEKNRESESDRRG